MNYYPNKVMVGIYKITNIVTRKFYIGSSKDIALRLRRHKMFLRNNNHENQRLQNSWNKYGEKNFVFSVISYCTEEERIYHEQSLINKLKPYYNINLIAVKPPSMKGTKRSEETNSKRWKSILQIDKKTKEVVCTFNSVKMAAISLKTNNPESARTGLSKCATGKQPTAYGYVWKYI